MSFNSSIPMPQEIRCLNSLTWIRYLERYHPEISVDLLLEPILINKKFRVKEELTGNLKHIDKNYLLNPDNWISSELITEMFIRAKEATRDPLFSYKVGSKMYYLLGPLLKRTALRLMSTKNIVKRIPKENDKLNRTKKVVVVKNEKRHAIVQLHFNEDLISKKFASKETCLHNRGAYESIAMLTGRLASIKEVRCTFEGANYCEFDIRWKYKPKIKRLLNFVRYLIAKDLIGELEEKEYKNLELQHNQEMVIKSRTQELKREKGKIENAHKLLSNYVAPQIAKKILEGEAETIYNHQRKKMTFFFSDVVNFTGITDSMEPELVAKLLNEYFLEMFKIIDKYEGTLAQMTGDGLYVFFGAPDCTNDRDHALRCVNMAIDMQSKVREIDNQWFNQGHVQSPFQIRCGINTGMATVGSYGTSKRMEYVAIGREVNIASRFESSAEPGGILIGHPTWGLTKDTIKCKKVERIEVKNISRPVLAYPIIF